MCSTSSTAGLQCPSFLSGRSRRLWRHRRPATSLFAKVAGAFKGAMKRGGGGGGGGGDKSKGVPHQLRRADDDERDDLVFEGTVCTVFARTSLSSILASVFSVPNSFGGFQLGYTCAHNLCWPAHGCVRECASACRRAGS